MNTPKTESSEQSYTRISVAGIAATKPAPAALFLAVIAVRQDTNRGGENNQSTYVCSANSELGIFLAGRETMQWRLTYDVKDTNNGKKLKVAMNINEVVHNKILRRIAVIYFIALTACNLIFSRINGHSSWLNLLLLIVTLIPVALNKPFGFKAFGLLFMVFWLIILLSVLALSFRVVIQSDSYYNPYLSLGPSLTIGYLISITSLTFSFLYYKMKRF